MNQVTLYPYDSQLYPEVIGADFEDGDPNHAYTVRYEKTDADQMMSDVHNWLFGESQ